MTKPLPSGWQMGVIVPMHSGLCNFGCVGDLLEAFLDCKVGWQIK